MSIILRVSEDLHAQFKEYTQEHNTTMSKVLIDYITTLVGNAGKAPAKEKNSGERTSSTVLYQCPYCGDELTGMAEVNRLKHIENCKMFQNGTFCSDISPISEKSSVLL